MKIVQALRAKSVLVVAAISASMLSVSAHATLPPEATAAITEAGTDLKLAVGAVIVAMVAVWGLRKLGAKMGWL